MRRVFRKWCRAERALFGQSARVHSNLGPATGALDGRCFLDIGSVQLVGNGRVIVQFLDRVVRARLVAPRGGFVSSAFDGVFGSAEWADHAAGARLEIQRRAALATGKGAVPIGIRLAHAAPKSVT